MDQTIPDTADLNTPASEATGTKLAANNCPQPPPPQMVFFARRDEYVDNLLKVVNSDPRLKQMGAEVEALHREYDTLAHHYNDIKAQSVAAAGKNKPKSTTRQ